MQIVIIQWIPVQTCSFSENNLCLAVQELSPFLCLQQHLKEKIFAARDELTFKGNYLVVF